MDHLGHSLHFSDRESALSAPYLKYSLGHPAVTDPTGAPAVE